MYPWQSGSDGREETQRLHLNPRSGRWLPDNSHRQRHVNIAVAYNVWQYYQATGDLEFLAAYGAEMLLEIARFWASIATYDHDRDRYEIRGVMGPDEYHDGYPDRDEPGLDNNAYTNVMAAWVLCRALETLELLPDHRRTELAERLGLAARGAGPLGGGQPQAARLLPRRRHHQPVRGLRRARGAGLGGPTAAATATSAGWTGSWRPRATPPTATRPPSRPTC